eukprot:g8067.t1
MASFAMGGGAPPAIEWQWNDDSRRWADYDATQSAAIEMAFMSGAPTATVASAYGGRAGTGATYTIVFSTMEQVNTASNFVRSVRRNAVFNGMPAYEKWEWKSNIHIGSRWEPVPIMICLQIQASRDTRRETFTTAHVLGLAHEFDFVQMQVTRQPAGDVLPLRRAAAVGGGAAAAAAAAGGGMTTRSGASVGGASSQPSGSNGSRVAEFQRVVNEATDCTATVGDNETCAVCIDGFSDDEPALLLSKCQGHYMHAACILKTFTAMGPKCPTCSKMYGALHGDQPDGTMTVRTHRRGAMPLSGHEGDGTIVIQYHFPSGTQGPKHPNPGRRYHGTSRSAYLPDNAQGKEILTLLRRSFDQRMTFTVGTSLTTGMSDCVIWNGVHHKTSPSGGFARFGYPDPGYFARVKAELVAKGIQ